jgi:tyrocidine synthetase III
MAPLKRPGAPATEAARNDLEAALVQSWRDVLGIASVGVHDDFFELGGHSLLAVTLASHISQLLNVDFRAGYVHDCPTVALQAEAIARALAEHAAGLGGDL